VLESHTLNGSLLKLIANVVDSSEKEIAVKSTVKPTVLPAAMQMDSSISGVGIIYDLNLKPVPIIDSKETTAC